MKILALEKSIDDADEQKIRLLRGKEAAQVWKLGADGLIRDMYFRRDTGTSVFILEAQTIQEAQAVIDHLPLVAEGLVEFELIPLGHYEPLAMLFVEEDTAKQ